MKPPVQTLPLLAASLLLSALPAAASSHTWEINEIYSNFDGSVQFIELIESLGSDGQGVFNGITISSTSATYTFGANITSSTANLRLVLATSSFVGLAGITPDFGDLPAGFFDPAGDTINFRNVDIVSFMGLPTNGSDSFNYSGGSGAGLTTATNTPTNLASQTGQVPEPSSALLLSLGAVVLLTRRRG
ncbi:MAG: PEP-CTERM sorting domain-containing protein [Verrucomicrobia bacterium]|nr:PEP-CTERM sorting domain-containing protein [Verrucomicrobiota bacterium]